jgi:hypothetical protein
MDSIDGIDARAWLIATRMYATSTAAHLPNCRVSAFACCCFADCFDSPHIIHMAFSLGSGVVFFAVALLLVSCKIWKADVDRVDSATPASRCHICFHHCAFAHFCNLQGCSMDAFVCCRFWEIMSLSQ